MPASVVALWIGSGLLPFIPFCSFCECTQISQYWYKVQVVVADKRLERGGSRDGYPVTSASEPYAQSDVGLYITACTNSWNHYMHGLFIFRAFFRR